MNKRIALFPGTFDPFTIGHQSLVSRGLALVDEIIISIGINDKKQTYFTLEKRMEAIRCLYKDVPNLLCAVSVPSMISSMKKVLPTSTGS